MRLLELSRDAGSASPQTLLQPQQLPGAAHHTVSVPEKPVRDAAIPRLFPLNARTTRVARRKPIDLEQLQQRIDVLEQRMQQRSRTPRDTAAIQDLDDLKQRLKRLEGSVSGELWAARQREHTLLEILSKPPLKQLVQQRLEKFWCSQLPAIRRWLQTVASHWWTDNQPGWWPQFARAWQESLKQARN